MTLVDELARLVVAMASADSMKGSHWESEANALVAEYRQHARQEEPQPEPSEFVPRAVADELANALRAVRDQPNRQITTSLRNRVVSALVTYRRFHE